MKDSYSVELEGLKSPSKARKKDGGGFWRTDPPVFDENNAILTGGMWPGQKEWWELPNFIKLLLGGYGSGKTISACKRALASALANAPAPVAMVSPTFSMAVDTTIMTITELLEGKRTLHPSLTWKFNSNRNRFHIEFAGRKATIIIYSGDNPLRLKGPNLAAAYIDEPFIQDFDVLTQMLARVRHPEAKLREIGLSGTPEQMTFGRELLEGELSEDFDIGYVRLSTRQNKAVDPSYVQNLERAYDEKTAQAYIEGYFVNLSEGRMYYSFGMDHSVVAKEMPDDAEYGVGMDFNVAPMTAAVFWYSPSENHIHVLDEYELANADTETMCRKLIDDWWDKGLRYIYPDPAGKQRNTSAPAGRSDFDVIKRMGFQILAHPKHTPRRDRFNAVNGALRDRPDTGPRLTIQPWDSETETGCRLLSSYMEDLTYENCTKRGKYGGMRMTHLTDAMSYAVDYIMPVGKGNFLIKPLVGY